MSAADWWRTGYAGDFARNIGRIADSLEKLAQDKSTREALIAYHNLAPALAVCVNECGESLLYTDLYQANEKARAVLDKGGDAH